MLVLSRKKQESLMIGDDIKILIVDIRGDRVKLGVEAPKNTPVHRREVYDAIKRQEAVGSAPFQEERGEAILEERAIALRDQVLKTWDHPLMSAEERKADIAQTAVMLSLAFVFGRGFLGPLSDKQEAAITGGLKLFEKVIPVA